MRTFAMKLTAIFLIAYFFFRIAEIKASDKQQKSGSINGQVVEELTRAAIPGATVMVVGTNSGAATDDNGFFEIKNIPVGSYSLNISSIGYDPLFKADIIVRTKRITTINIELTQRAIEIEGTKVRGSYFVESEEQPTSTTGFSAEEIRRSPGSAGDVSRIMLILPSVAKVNDMMNSLIVRGGTPTENGFYLDNIEIPNINHYPAQGSSGGPIGLLNVDFLQDATFSAGGFPATYGDRLSSIMELKYREGNREEFDAQADVNFAGFGISGEGPINNGKGSWLMSARRSFLDLLVDAIGTGVAPRYSDYQGKVVYDLSPSNKLMFLGVLGVDDISFDKKQSEDDGNIVYGDYSGYEYTVGVNWQYLWSKNGYSNTSLSLLSMKQENTFYETKSDIQLTDDNTYERAAQFRNVNVYQLSDRNHIQFGTDVRYLFNDYNAYMAEYTNPIGDTVPPLNMIARVESPKIGLFGSCTISPLKRLSLTGGLRYEYFDYNEHSHLSPRFSFTYELTERLSLNGATGVYYQFLPAGLLAQHEKNKKLEDPVAYHYILGLKYLLSETTELTLEGYYKNYENFPIDTMQPQLFVADELVYRGFMGNYLSLVDKGVAESYGIELTLQKKLRENFYGLVSASFFRSKYRGLDNIWRDRVYDNQVVIGVEGGYKPNNKWEFSIRWIYAGGPPYTPLDLVQSKLIDRSVYERNRVNEERMPDYHSMNVRIDRRYNFSGSNLIVYFSVWNVYNRQNVYSYYWNETDKKQDVMYQWTMLPVFGLEFEF